MIGNFIETKNLVLWINIVQKIHSYWNINGHQAQRYNFLSCPFLWVAKWDWWQWNKTSKAIVSIFSLRFQGDDPSKSQSGEGEGPLQPPRYISKMADHESRLHRILSEIRPRFDSFPLDPVSRGGMTFWLWYKCLNLHPASNVFVVMIIIINDGGACSSH